MPQKMGGTGMTNIDIKHACTFTGHRPEKLDAPEEQVKEWLEEQIRQAVMDGNNSI